MSRYSLKREKPKIAYAFIFLHRDKWCSNKTNGPPKITSLGARNIYV